MVVHEAVPVRQPIAESWRRSRDAGIDAGVAAAPLVFDRDVLADARAAHPLERHLPMLEALLRQVADETEHLMVITDETGNALWTQGPPAVRRSADAIGLTEGFRWAEDAVGTNGIGTALATGRPEYVYAAEHIAHVLHGWSCAGAPVTDPDTGRIVGCIDVSATVDALHPATVALVAAAARLAESRLENEMLARDERLRERLLPHLRGLRGAGALVTPTGRIIAGERLRGPARPRPGAGRHGRPAGRAHRRRRTARRGVPAAAAGPRRPGGHRRAGRPRRRGAARRRRAAADPDAPRRRAAARAPGRAPVRPDAAARRDPRAAGAAPARAERRPARAVPVRRRRQPRDRPARDPPAPPAVRRHRPRPPLPARLRGGGRLPHRAAAARRR
ncbi:GAF domain-containing protein [Actinomadura madurae]|uniref:GAF domain-containing protein n=1 Tax=Actinomadura madurae TaxID=1993 RepID=UPI0020D22D92|nr:GAF domain-containing protein [Actinomadura madurae]MCP9948638.1 GAF domain-containing protein [Actinomadura madurae]